MRATTHALVPPTPTRKWRITSHDGVRLNTEVHGPEDAPTVVLSHGWTLAIPIWAAVIRALRDDYRVVVYDQRGHGESDCPGHGGYSTAVLVEDLRAVLDATLRPGERAVLAGHSMGGMTLIAAGADPAVTSRASAVLLASTGAADLVRRARVAPFAGRLRRVSVVSNRSLLTSAAPMGPVTPVTRAALRYGLLGKQASKEVAALSARIIQSAPRKPRAEWGRVLLNLDVANGIGGLTMPTAVLCGASDRLTPPIHSRRLASSLCACTKLTEIPGVGHMTPIEAPEIFAAQVRTLAREVAVG